MSALKRKLGMDGAACLGTSDVIARDPVLLLLLHLALCWHVEQLTVKGSWLLVLSRLLCIAVA
jgi:hypothetical protein